jgi:deoxyribodipyrimidine photolyase-related protein
MKRYKQKYKNFRFSTFYKWHKKELDIIPEIKSQDKLNRKKLDISVPTLQSYSTKRFVEEAKEYVEKYFPKNYGTTENFIYPVTHKKAREMLLNFFSSKLEYFGDYQDAITKEDNYLFHSVLSSSINIGLLNPCEIIVKIPNFVRLNSLEGYIRQLFWREFQRYTYLNVDFENKNYFGNKKKLRKAWYEGTLGIDPVDDAIKDGFETGYLHHIRRLMVVGNYMNLSGIHPKEGFRWFMEFSVDSYEWVMHQNVLDMVFFVTDGKTSRKPYISSSNYIRRMSDYKKGQWSVTWDTMYRTFIQKHKNKLSRYHFRL